MRVLITILIVSIGLTTQVFSQDFSDDFYNSEKHLINSEFLNSERQLFIYLPNNYAIDTSRTYPVHYLSDAPLISNIYFDLLRLHTIRNNAPQCIVVGLSSDDRNHNLHPEMGADTYLEFIEQEVIPFIEGNYRTKPFRVLSGHSLGGDFSIYSLLKKPVVFNAYIAGSPGPIESIIKILDETGYSQGLADYTFFYTSIGSLDDTDTMVFNRFSEKMKLCVDKKIDCNFEIHAGEDHISNIAINFQAAIRKLYADWQYKLPDSLENSVQEELKMHYDNLENKFGYRPEVGEWEVIFPLMDRLAKRHDYRNAIDILNYCIELYPKSDQAYAFLAKAYFDTGQMEAGMHSLNKALEINPENDFAKGMKAFIDSK